MTPDEDRLYRIYAAWSGILHNYCIKYLHSQLNCEFYPDEWVMKLYPGKLRERELHPWGFSTVPGFERPPNAYPFRLPRPESNPTPEELDQTFRALCYAAAKVLEIDLGKLKLKEGEEDDGLEPKRTAPKLPAPNGPKRRSRRRT